MIMKINEIVLKPCPFCGSSNLAVADGSHTRILSDCYKSNIRVVVCLDCGVNGGIFNLYSLGFEEATEKAISSWNLRFANNGGDNK